mmetsp:Transcript_8643/g.30909  ORF Transcript_8643/g.30909 Transcript_8643/m.30909 type:complete len:812 (+) Transcript_8643:184-2619(+)
MEAAARRVAALARRAAVTGPAVVYPERLPEELLSASVEALAALPPALRGRLALGVAQLAHRWGGDGRNELGRLLRQLAPTLQWESFRDIGRMASAFTKATMFDRDLLVRMLRQGGSLRPSAPDLSNLLWAAAQLRSAAVGLPELAVLLASPKVEEHLAALKGVDIARVLWALGTLRQDNALAFGCTRLLAEDPASVGTQCLANLLWAAARVRRTVPMTLHAELARRDLPDPELSASLWALAEHGDSANPLWGAAAALLSNSWRPLPSPRATSSLLWAHAKVRKAAPARLTGVAHVVARREYEPRSLANALWALARLGQPLSADDVSSAAAAASSLREQEFSNVLWAFGAMDRPPRSFFEHIELPCPSRLQVQHISNILWAFASVSVRRLDILEPLAREALGREDFSLQAAANIAWSFATLCVHCPELSIHLRHVAHCRLDDADAQDGSQERDAVSLLGLLWALGPDDQIRDTLRSIGVALDGYTRDASNFGKAGRRQQRLPSLPLSMVLAGESSLDPEVVLKASGALVLHKPPDWEVDTIPGHLALGAKPLSAAFDSCTGGGPAKDPKHGFGFLGRLDTSSSGLVLQATTFEGLYDLRAQRELGLIEREYVVLCRGHVPGARSILARIRKRTQGRSEVALDGRPAQSQLKVLAHLARDSQQLSLVLVRICTGRTHQIRCHLQYVGHPVVCDGRYGTKGDVAWCPRTFLHRHRLVFWDLDGVRRVAEAPLPPDLRGVLAALVPPSPPRLGAVARGSAELWAAGEGAGRPWSSWQSLEDSGSSASGCQSELSSAAEVSADLMELPWLELTMHT